MGDTWSFWIKISSITVCKIILKQLYIVKNVT